MDNLKEMKVGDNEVILKDNIVKSSILPQSSKELARNVIVQGNSVIEGAVFGEQIDILGGQVDFQGAVFANDELHIANEISQPVHFRKAVACSDTVSGFIASSMAIFDSDINAKKIRLKNCYIGGSVFGEEVQLDNCIVLGGVFAIKNAIISNCMIGTFHIPSVELSGINYLLYPACFSVEPLSYLPNTKLYNLALADLGSIFKGDPEKENTGCIEMDLVNDQQRTVLTGEKDVTTIINSYSISSRVLAADMIDFDKFENHFLLEAGALGSQVLKVYTLTKEDGTKSQELTVENIAKFLFGILKGTTKVQPLKGEISFSELKASFM